jgi:hypothetical protein
MAYQKWSWEGASIQRQIDKMMNGRAPFELQHFRPMHEGVPQTGELYRYIL